MGNHEIIEEFCLSAKRLFICALEAVVAAATIVRRTSLRSVRALRSVRVRWKALSRDGLPGDW
jgi:hypothetical protein